MTTGPDPTFKERAHESVWLANRAWIRTLAGSDPEISLASASVLSLRVRADREALWGRYHDPDAFSVMLSADPAAGLFLTTLERGRVWTRGARAFCGVGRNLECYCAGRFADFSPRQQLEYLAFVRLAQRPSPPEDDWDDLAALWPGLIALIEDQKGFARAVLTFWETSPRVRDLARDWAAESETADAFLPAMPPIPDESATIDSPSVPVPAARTGEDLPDAGDGYRIYNTAFDRTAPAETLGSPAARDRYYRQLEKEFSAHRTTVIRLARRLMRQIMSRQQRTWNFDLEEGVLNPKRLAGLAADPANHRIFMQETESPFPASVVGLLIDNSGSMKGRSIRLAALTAEILSAALERCGVKTEILGYTTAAWNGGRVRPGWQAGGASPRPGRLNERLHIIYKDADTPRRRARRNLGVMLMPDLLKENIDGEALDWAWRRLLARPEPRRILLVICDGDPHDEATLETNGPDFLARHLRAVIDKIQQSPVQLGAIGIGHPVGRFYRRAVFLEKPEDLGRVLCRELWLLLAPSAI